MDIEKIIRVLNSVIEDAKHNGEEYLGGYLPELTEIREELSIPIEPPVKAANGEFSCYTIDANIGKQMYKHWAEDLTMTISKNGVRIELTEDEIQKLVKSLPRTVSGRY